MSNPESLLIDRLQVEEGFLDGLDLSFKQGLNVLLGSRGAGKTSIIELIRLCLGTPGYTKRSSTQAREHAISVLGSGQATLTCRVGEQLYTVSRTAEDQIEPLKLWPLPMVLSHNEIESIGLHAPGRLSLIDSFVVSDHDWRTRESSLCAHVSSLSAQVQAAAAEVRAIDSQLEDLRSVDQDLQSSAVVQEEQLKLARATDKQRLELEQLNAQGAILGVRCAVYQRAHDAIEAWEKQLSAQACQRPALETLEGDDGPLREAGQKLDRVVEQLEGATKRATEARETIASAWRSSHEQRSAVDDQARRLRQQLEALQEGAGTLARRVAALQEKAGQRKALVSLRHSKQAALERARAARKDALAQLDSLRSDRFLARAQIAKELNSQLRPTIKVLLTRLSEHQEYESAIAAMLRGSGLQYNAIASNLASTLSPLELAIGIEDSISDLISECAQVSTQRAERLIAHAQNAGTEAILSTSIEDGVRIRLLVGAEYKDSESLSTGQRCTAVLPIILGADRRVVVIDQPEDHLDNAFIAGTVIQSLRGRRPGSQIICATHNANIPVLGEASHVVVMDSDGKRGFVRHSGSLDADESVEAITTIMEGGREAFARRARFYGVQGQQ
ncbi:MAG TPA: AAA family ATPase [Planctomycetota bacterium]|nr:AAA family ATPase [Planctomycetota bacterium]